jgi:uncharacterized protein (DUF1684 family)
VNPSGLDASCLVSCLLSGLLSCLLVEQASAEPAGPAPPGAAVPAGYRKEIEDWRAQREVKLRADGGWLTVAGLFWLAPGINRFGAAPANEILLPGHSAPARAGVFRLEAGHVTVEVLPGVPVFLAGKPVTRVELRSDAAGEPDVLTLGALSMQVIARGGRLGVRLKDMRSAARQTFKGLSWFPVRPQYRVSARFVPHPAPTTIAVATVIGGVETMPSPGSALFELDGKSVRLDPVLEAGETQLFFIFRDATSGRSTYGAGRFLYADPPRDGRIVLDFNKAYSPPCAFTPYATCPLPPAQNRLPSAIEAGEMTPAGH